MNAFAAQRQQMNATTWIFATNVLFLETQLRIYHLRKQFEFPRILGDTHSLKEEGQCLNARTHDEGCKF
jgi:hypothetical protein